MKQILYGYKDGDGMWSNLCFSGHKHFIAEQIQSFYKKVGQFVPVDWFLLGEYDTKSGLLTSYSEPIIFDWEKQLSDDLLNDDSDGIETSSIAKEVSCES